CKGDPAWLFTENDTNVRRHYGQTDATGHFKDAFHEYLVAGNRGAVNSEQTGTKAAAHYELRVRAGSSASVRVRLSRSSEPTSTNSRNGARGATRTTDAFSDFDTIFTQRRREADEFYAELQEDIADPDARLVQRQAFAGMIWSKQFFYYDVPEWIRG